MTTKDIILLEDTFQVPTYRKMPIALERGEGSFVWDADGHRYLDFYGGHCVTLLGHCPPRVVAAIQRQAAELMFYSNVVYSSVRARAARMLAKAAPDGLGHVFFCNSGTEANETALKIARKATGKMGVVAMQGDFHGRTLGSLATTWGKGYQHPYEPILPYTHFVPLGDIQALTTLFSSRKDIAAVILEPIQSMAGIDEASEEYYQQLSQLCKEQGVVLIFDEVQTGVGRTGTFSVSEQYGMKPDMITLAKSLGSGVPVGAVLVSKALAAGVEYGDQGTTFGGGMLAMAAVQATLEVIVGEDLMQRATVVEHLITEASLPYVHAVRGRGCLLGLEMDQPVAPVIARLREEGILVGSSSNPRVMRLMPALTTTEEEVIFFADMLARVCRSQKA